MPNLPNALAWFLLAFAIFNTYMLLWRTAGEHAVFLVFLTLEITEILLVIGNFNVGARAREQWLAPARRLGRHRHRRSSPGTRPRPG